MLRAFILLSAVLCTGTAAAQSKWVDRDGRVTYGDAPPAGVNAAPMRRAPAPLSRVEDAPADKDNKDDAKDAKDAKKPLTPAEQDAAFRKRQQEAEKDREKHAKAERDLADKRDNCTRARDYTRTLDAGRVVRTDAKGENYYLDEAQIAQERKRAQEIIQQSCN